MAAVASGSTPVTTAACMDGTWRSANARPSGNPTTVPSAHRLSGNNWLRRGRGAAVKASYTTLSSPAQAARPAGDEQRRQLRRVLRAHSQARHRQRHRKDQHAQRAQPQAAGSVMCGSGVHARAIQTVVATSSAAIMRLNHSSRRPCCSQGRSTDPSAA